MNWSEDGTPASVEYESLQDKPFLPLINRNDHLCSVILSAPSMRYMGFGFTHCSPSVTVCCFSKFSAFLQAFSRVSCLFLYNCTFHFFPAYTQKTLFITISTTFRTEGINLHLLTFMSSFGWQLFESLRCYLKCQMWRLKCVEMQFNLPFCAGTRCRRHRELPAKQHTLQTQQTPGTHWETPSLRERHTQRPVLVQIHTRHSTSPHFRGRHRCNQQWHPVMCTPSLFPSPQHSSLSSLSSVSHPQESSLQSGEKWQKSTKTSSALMFSACINGSTCARQR